MHLSLEELDEVERELIITVPSETFEKRIEKCMAASTRTANREGHNLSLEEVRRRHGQEIREMIVGHIVEEGVAEIIKREELKPIGEATTDIVNMDAGSDLLAVVTFQVLPEIELCDLSDIVLRHPDLEITDEDIDRSIYEYRRLRGGYREVRRPVREDDRVTFVYADNVDGERYVEESENEVRIAPDTRGKIGNQLVHAEYSQVLMGAELGEFRPAPTTELDEYADVEENTVVEIVVTKIEQAVLPALDADFMSLYGIEDGDMAAFREHVRQMMIVEAMQRLEMHVRQQMIDQFAAMYPIRMPDVLVQAEVDQEKERKLQLLREARQEEADLSDESGELDDEEEGEEEDEDLPDEWFLEEAEKEALFHLVLTTIIDAENITPDEDQVREKIDEIAERSQDPKRLVKHFYDDEDMLRGIEAQVLGRQAFEHIIEAATIEPVPCSYQEAMWGSYIEPRAMKSAREA